MGRYVILRHDFATRGRDVHWDLMLEVGQVLRTWALADAPAFGTAIAAEQLSDHRLAYLDYEGPISGNRGSISRWDCGQFTILSESPDRLDLRITGDRLKGDATLRRQAEDSATWEFALQT